jgi:hypothetical protein
MASSITLSAAVLAGVAGSGHCLAMCGGLAGALGMRARARAADGRSTLRNAGIYHLGRLGGYALAGGLCGVFGAALRSALDLSSLTVALRVASGALIVLVGLRVLVGWNALRGLERAGAHFWRRLQPLARYAAQSDTRGRALLLGFLWGWLPCGLVYSMLLFAALSGSALQGAAIMIAFGIGTLPSMLTGSVFAAELHQWLSQRWPRTLSGALLLVFGLWLGIAPLRMGQHAHPHLTVEAPVLMDHSMHGH